ncbi:MAG: hypothetical protein K8R36_17590 [Planctomycetales bacterium]|nr:hypothetical protein [Planctomycetales bacterium]
MLRFSIRELMLVMLIVGMGLGWWLHYRRVDVNRQAIIQHAEHLRRALVGARSTNLALEGQLERAWRGEGGLFINIPPDWNVLNERIPVNVFYEPAANESNSSE